MRSRSILAVLSCALMLSALRHCVSGPAQAEVVQHGAFSPVQIDEMASELAKKPFVPPQNVPDRWANLTYDQYRDVRFRRERGIWHGEHRNFELQLLPGAWLYKSPVTIYIVTGGVAHALKPDNSLFEFGNVVGQPPPDAEPLPFSGFRLNGPINRPTAFDEIMVFQGASYFRGISRSQVYGLSARGLAIDTAEPSGEEFPFFRTFWVETPPTSSRQLAIHALLDSPSSTGAYRFRVSGGAPTVAEIDVKLYPRRDIHHVGIAPLTSMLLFSRIDRSRINDFRQGVHDSDGLAIFHAGSERLWRPLTNPRRLQISAFSVRDLIGFGLLQRNRSFFDFNDLEANYERRPSAWVEPHGAWGEGSVHLVEIPSEEEIHDNIVAYWQPFAPLAKDQAYAFSYRLSWPDDVRGDRVTVYSTAAGLTNGPERKNGAIHYAVDFVGPALGRLRNLPRASLSSTAGKLSTPVVQRNPHTGGVRVDFLLTPGEAELAELRLELKSQDRTISEVWLSRWIK